METLALTGPAAGLPGGFNLNGIVVRGKTIWAVQNFLNQVSRVKLNNDLSAGAVKDVIKSDAFDIPTTAALFGNTLAVVNAQFMRPPSPNEVVLLPARSSGHDNVHDD